MSEPDIPCLEGDPAYDVTWPWHDGKLRTGLTCVFRVKNEARNLPWVLILLFALVLGYSLFTNRAVAGRQIYAIGGNLQAAVLSGVKVKAIVFWLFVNMGVLAALAGIVFAARLNLANPTNGTAFELDAIAAAFIGGAAVTGGVGRVIGAIVGGLTVGVLNNGMSILGVDVAYQQVIKGLVLLAAVGFDVWNKRRVGA